MPSPPVKKILLIDDDPMQHLMLSGFVSKFRQGPWELDTADTYEAGLKKLLSERHEVCLLDYRLGDHDGLELLQTAQREGCRVPVLFLTGDDREETDDAAMNAGALDYLVKGEITPRILEQSVRYARKLGQTLAKLSQMATRDALTGLFNRREFDRLIEEEWQRSVRFGRPFSLVLTDIDFFKKVNDTHGHPAGDDVLSHVASLLSGQVRNVDRVARYGGEEFAIIMVETERKHAAEHLERLFALLAEIPCVTRTGVTLPVTLSAGVAMSGEDGDSPAALIAAADSALYQAKHTGRNRLVCAKPARQ